MEMTWEHSCELWFCSTGILFQINIWVTVAHLIGQLEETHDVTLLLWIMKEHVFPTHIGTTIAAEHQEDPRWTWWSKEEQWILFAITNLITSSNKFEDKRRTTCKWQVRPTCCQDTAASTPRNPTVRSKLWFLLYTTWMWIHHSTQNGHILVSKVLFVRGICTCYVISCSMRFNSKIPRHVKSFAVEPRTPQRSCYITFTAAHLYLSTQ